MISITLRPAEFAAVELPCDDTLTSLTLSASGKLEADVQASPCGLTWASPCASARLDREERTLLFTVPQGTRKIRVLLRCNTSRSAKVQIQDLASAVAPVVQV
jgi:hypothetical protein